MSEKTPGQIAYEAFWKNIPGCNLSIPDAIDRWEAAANAVAIAAVEQLPLAFTKLTDSERLAFLDRFECCRHCGSLDTRCRCNDDD